MHCIASANARLTGSNRGPAGRAASGTFKRMNAAIQFDGSRIDRRCAAVVLALGTVRYNGRYGRLSQNHLLRPPTCSSLAFAREH